MLTLNISKYFHQRFLKQKILILILILSEEKLDLDEICEDFRLWTSNKKLQSGVFFQEEA